MSKRTNLIRAFKSTDINDVLNIWLRDSIEAHSFVDREFWESKVDNMRKTYIPASDTYVFMEDNIIKGFFSLHGKWLAAMFVTPDFQGKGIGQKLIKKAKSLRKRGDLGSD